MASTRCAGPSAVPRVRSARVDRTRGVESSTRFRLSGQCRGERSRAVPRGLPAHCGAGRKVQLLVPSRTFRTEGPEGACRVSYDDIDLLKVLNMDPVPANAATMMPAWSGAGGEADPHPRSSCIPRFSRPGFAPLG